MKVTFDGQPVQKIDTPIQDFKLLDFFNFNNKQYRLLGIQNDEKSFTEKVFVFDSKMQSKTEKILFEVLKERKKQNLKWNVQDHKPMEWLPILMEEVGEASKEALDYHFKNNPSPVEVLENEGFEDGMILMNRLKKYRKEMIQVAAVAISMIESFDRNEASLLK